MKSVFYATFDAQTLRQTLLLVRYASFDVDEVANVPMLRARRFVMCTDRVPSRHGIHRYSGFRTRNP
jgi:hypothetical protein